MSITFNFEVRANVLYNFSNVRVSQVIDIWMKIEMG